MIDKEFSKEVNKHFELWADMAIQSMQESFKQVQRIQEEALKMQAEAKFGKAEPKNPSNKSG